MATVSRRDFLKGSIAAGAGCALAGAFGARPLEAFAEGAQTSETTERFSHCRMCMEAECGLILTERDGVVVDVRGNPDCLGNQGTMCSRGKTIAMSTYNPHRVKAPMKRTNPKKGLDEDPGWVEISWDEALDLVAEKFGPVFDEDPAQIIAACGFSTMEFWLGVNIMNMPASGMTRTGVPGSMCNVHYGGTTVMANFPTCNADYIHSRYVINMGINAGATTAIATDGVSKGLVDAVANGMKMVTIDPHAGMDAKFGEWVPIKPGEDLAFLYGMLHCLMYEIDVKDEWYLRNRSNAPYLIPEDGTFDYFRNADGKPMMWDLQDQMAKPFDDEAFADGSFDGEAMRRIALEGHFEVDGVKVQTGYTFNKEAIKDYTPEWAESRCTIPAAKIREISQDFVDNAGIGDTININGHIMPLRGSCLAVGRGLCNHEEGPFTDLVSRAVNEIIGAVDVPGGINGCMPSFMFSGPDKDGVVTPVHIAAGFYRYQYPTKTFSMAEYFPCAIADAHTTLYNLMAQPKGIEHQKCKGMLVVGTNMVCSGADPELMAEAIATKIPFTVTLAYDMDEMAVLSDVLLPIHSHLESESISKNYGPQNCITPNCATNINQIYRDPIPTLYDTRLAQDVYLQILERSSADQLARFNAAYNECAPLADETGGFSAVLRDDLRLDLDKRYDYHDLFDRTLRSYYGDEYGTDYMKKHGFIDVRLEPHETYNYSAFPLNKVRNPFYFHNHWKIGRDLLANIDKQNPEHKDFPPGFSIEKVKETFDPTWKHKITYIMEDKGDFDLRAFNYRVTGAMYRFSIGDQNPWIDDWNEEFNPYYAVLLMNSATAAKKGIKSGDVLKVESFEGTEIQGKVCVSELVHPEALGICGAFGRSVKSGLGAISEKHKDLFLNRLIKTHIPKEGDTDQQWKMIEWWSWTIESTINVKVTKL